MGMRTNAVLTALNYILDNQLDKENKRREDERKLRNTEAMLRLQNDIAEYYNPGQRESREWANKASAGRNKNIVSNLADEDMLTKLNNSNAINDALFQQEIKPVSQDLTRKDLNFKLANIDQRQELESGKLARELDDLNYEMLNKDKIREDAAKKGDLSLQLLAEQVANARANRNLINMKAKAADEYAAIRKMYAENKINGGGGKEAYKAKYKGLDPIRLATEKRQTISEMNKIRDKYNELGEEDKTEANIEYQMLQDQYDALVELEKENSQVSSNNSGLYNLIKGVGQAVMNKIAPYNELVNKGITNYETTRKAEAIAKEVEEIEARKRKTKTSPQKFAVHQSTKIVDPHIHGYRN